MSINEYYSFVRKLSTLHLSGALDPHVGGPPEALSGILGGLISNGIIATVIAIKSDEVSPPVLKTIKNRGGLIHEVKPSFGLGRFKASASFPLLFRRLVRDADIVISHGFYSISLLIAVRTHFIHKKPIVVMPHGSLEPYQEKVHRLRKLFFKALLGGSNNIDGFFVASQAEARTLKTHSWIRKPIFVAGLGVEKPNFHLPDLEQSEGFQNPYIAFLGRIASKKRIDLAIVALRELRNSGVNVDLRIAGIGDELITNELQNLVKNLQLGENVYFEGLINGNAKIRFLADAAISILPSENENFAVAIAESLSVGTPVVVSEFVALGELVKEFHAGIVIKELKPECIAKAFLEIQSNRDYYSNGAFDAAESISLRAVGATWSKMIKDIVGTLK